MFNDDDDDDKMTAEQLQECLVALISQGRIVATWDDEVKDYRFMLPEEWSRDVYGEKATPEQLRRFFEANRNPN